MRNNSRIWKRIISPVMSMVLCGAMFVSTCSPAFTYASTTAAEESTGATAPEPKGAGAAPEMVYTEISAETEGAGASVKVAGELPPGAKVTITPISGENERYGSVAFALSESGFQSEGFAAYDISILNAKGGEIEPDSYVSVSLYSAQELSGKNPEGMTVVHLKENENGDIAGVTDLIAGDGAFLSASQSGVEANFKTGSFSIFVVTWQSESRWANVSMRPYSAENWSELSAQVTNFSVSGGDTINFNTDSRVKIQGYKFSFACMADTAWNDVDGTHITALKLERLTSGQWRYTYTRENGTTGTLTGTYYVKLFYLPAIAGDADSVTFYYTGYSDIDGAGSITTEKNDASVMRYTIVLVDENGNELETEYLDQYAQTLSPNEGARIKYPAEYTFDTDHLNISAATINKMGISIPGFTFTNGYAYFFYKDYFGGDKVSVTDIINTGVKADRNTYDSFLGYTGVYYDINGEAQDRSGSDYDNYASYWAYNPTGTIRLVFQRVSETVKYHVNYVDAFNTANPSLEKQNDMEMVYDVSSGKHYGQVKAIAGVIPAGEHAGYAFAGWYKSTDSAGNGAGDMAQTDVSNAVRFETDVYYYAKWVMKTVDGFVFTLTKNWRTDSGSAIANENIPFASIQADVNQYYIKTENGADKKVIVNSAPMTLSPGADGIWTAQYPDTVFDYTIFEVTGERYYDAGGNEVSKGDFTADFEGFLFTRDYLKAGVDFTKVSSLAGNSVYSFKITGSSIVLVKKGSDFVLWMPNIERLNLDEEKRQAIKMACAAETGNGGVIAQNIRFCDEISESVLTGVTVTFLDGGEVKLDVGASSNWSLFWYGPFEFSNPEAFGKITNTLNTGKTQDITVTKIWQDENNAASLRPESVTLRFACGDYSGYTVLTEENKVSDNTWQGAVKVPVYDAGTGAKLFFTISEDDVDNYAAQYNQERLTVTNTLKTGTLIIKKNVNAETVARLAHIVSLLDGKLKFSYGGEEITVNTKDSKTIYSGGVFTITVENVPVGMVTVAEEDFEVTGYICTADVSAAGKNVRIEAGETAEVIFENSYVMKRGYVNIEKNLVKSASDQAAVSAKSDGTYVFTLMGTTIAGEKAEYSVAVTVKKGETCGVNSIGNILFGDYTVSEHDGINGSFAGWQNGDNKVSLYEGHKRDSVSAMNSYKYHVQADSSAAVNKFSFKNSVWSWVKQIFVR